MSEASGAVLSVSALFAERDERRRREQEAEEQLKQKTQEELAEFKKRLDHFQLTDAQVQVVLGRIESAFDRGETELMLTSFPSSFCTASGRAISNAGEPPINKPAKQEAAKSHEPDWLATLPAGARIVYEYWKKHLQPRGFSFTARIINYPDGKPGDIGLFFGWPKSSADIRSPAHESA